MNQIHTSQKNPQFVYARGNTIYVVNSGETQFDISCFCFLPITPGGIDIFDANQATSANAPNGNIAIPLTPSNPTYGFPGSMGILSNGLAYLGSNAGIVFKVDLNSQTLLRGTDQPIIVTNDSSDNLINIGVDDQDLVYVLSFNEDRAYLLDTSQDIVANNFISLDSDPQCLRGSIRLGFSRPRVVSRCIYFNEC